MRFLAMGHQLDSTCTQNGCYGTVVTERLLQNDCYGTVVTERLVQNVRSPAFFNSPFLDELASDSAMERASENMSDPARLSPLPPSDPARLSARPRSECDSVESLSPSAVE
jgi:hypothetical protein